MANQPTSASGLSNVAQGLRKGANRSLGEQVIGFILLFCAVVSILTTIGVIFALTRETWYFFASPEVTFKDFFTGREWTPLFGDGLRKFGILPLLSGTLVITFIGLLVGVPLGLGAAIYLSEFATKRMRSIIMPILELLAGIPTIVLGYFALLQVTPFLKDLQFPSFFTNFFNSYIVPIFSHLTNIIYQGLHLISSSFWPSLEEFYKISDWSGYVFPDLAVSNALSAGIVVGFMLLPTISSISTDAMRAVPDSLRQASYGLGSTKGEVITKVVMPAALSGIVAAIILAMSRAIGETMIVTLAAGQKANFTFDPRQTVETMTAFIANTAQGDQEAGSIGSLSLYAVGSTLFVLTLILNIISQQIVRRFSEKYE